MIVWLTSISELRVMISRFTTTGLHPSISYGDYPFKVSVSLELVPADTGQGQDRARQDITSW